MEHITAYYINSRISPLSNLDQIVICVATRRPRDHWPMKVHFARCWACWLTRPEQEPPLCLWALPVPWSIRQRVNPLAGQRKCDARRGACSDADTRWLLRVHTADTSRIHEARRELQFAVGFKISDLYTFVLHRLASEAMHNQWTSHFGLSTYKDYNK